MLRLKGVLKTPLDLHKLNTSATGEKVDILHACACMGVYVDKPDPCSVQMQYYLAAPAYDE